MKNILTFTFLFCSICISFCQIDPNTINTFHPDPITTLNQTKYMDFDDFKPDSFFEPAYVDRVISYISISEDEILGSNVNIKEIEDPKIIDDLNKQGDLKVQRSDPRFKAYNAYYHADNFIGWLKGLSTSSTANLPIINIDPYTTTGNNGSQIISDNEIKYITHFNENLPADPIAVESVDMAEDAFGVAFGMTDMYLLHAKKEIVNDNLLTTIGGFKMEDVEIGLMDYLAQSYVHSLGTVGHKCYKWGGQPSVEIGNGIELVQQRYTDFTDVGRDFDPDDFPDIKTSQWLSSTLMAINENTSREKCDKWIMNSLSAEYADNFVLDNNFGEDDMYQYIWYLFDVALDVEDTNGKVFSNDDLCAIYTEFSLTYGENFWKYSEELPAAAGDIYISDYTADIGVEPHSQTAYNSPHLWNRNIADNIVGNQKAIKGQPNFLYVRINGDLCDLTSSQTSGSGMELKVYYNSVIGTTWAPGTPDHDWEHDDATDNHHRYGDLIGTFNLVSHEFTYDDEDDNGSPIIIDLNVIKYSNHSVIEIPWTPPVELDDLPWKTLFSYDFSYLARLTSPTFDPIANPEGIDVHKNSQNNNNIAYKRNIWWVEESDVPGQGGNASVTPGITITGDPDPNDPVIKFTIRPASHDPNPNDFEPDEPVHPEFNDYDDFGDAVIVLDPDLFIAWTAGGQRGTGFTVNADNEIIANNRDFFIEGLSLPGRDLYSAIGVKFIPNTPILEKRTAFDLVQWGVQSGKELDAVHVEVRPGDEGSSAPRSTNVNELDKVSIYPNPAQDYFTITSNTIETSKIKVYSVSNERMNVSYNNIDANTTRVNIENLSAGIYFVRIQRAEQMETVKFVKL